METIKEAKTFLKENYSKGCTCPACGQYVRLYERKLNSVMARALINLYKIGEGVNPVHVKEIIKGISDTGTNDFSKLMYWKMIEEEINENSKTKTSGVWKITKLGIDFVNGKSFPKSVMVYNNKVRGFHIENTTIEESLGVKFNYKELMNYE